MCDHVTMVRKTRALVSMRFLLLLPHGSALICISAKEEVCIDCPSVWRSPEHKAIAHFLADTGASEPVQASVHGSVMEEKSTVDLHANKRHTRVPKQRIL